MNEDGKCGSRRLNAASFSVDRGRVHPRLRPMITHTVACRRAGLEPRLSFSLNLRALSRLLALLLLVGALTAWAEEGDDAYLNIITLVDDADTLHKGKKLDAAKMKYLEAQAALLKIRKDNRNWNPRLVAARLTYVAEKISELSPRIVPPEERGIGTTPAPTPAAGPQVKLLEAGAEPRQVLRLKPKPGEKQSVTMTAKTTLTVESPAGPAPPVSMPGIQMTLSLSPKSVSPDGVIDFELVLAEVEVLAGNDVPPPVAEAVKASMTGMKGLLLAGTMTDRGFGKKIEATIPAGTSPVARKAMEEMKDSVADTKFILPEESVGQGAKWEIKNRIKPQGVTIDTTTTYELVSMEGTVLTIRSAIRQTAGPQKIPNPFLPGSMADLTKFASTGTETLTVDLAKVFPIRQSIDSHDEKSIVMDVAGQKQAISVKTDTNVRVEPK